MTVTRTQVAEEQDRQVGRVPVAWLQVGLVTVAVVALLLATAGLYGYHADELYFRLLGERGPTWGYVDQPPLLPLLAHAAVTVLGDTLWAIRLPAVLCAAAVVVLSALIAAELGGGRRAQTLTAFGLGTSMMVLTFGHFVVTSSVDMVMWALVLLYALRALLRGNGRWWLAVGAVCGLALYAKYVVLLLPLSLLLGLALVGPRRALRDRWLAAGAGLALLIGLPNLLYQVFNDFPQLQMAQALGEIDGASNRAMFATNLLFLLGPGLAVFWVTGIVGTLRERPWRPVRAVGVAYLLSTGAALAVAGGRPDYTGGFLIALLAAGFVLADRWMSGRRWRVGLVGAGVLLTTAVQLLLGAPVIPQAALADFPVNSMSVESVGWEALAGQVGDVYRGLPEAERRAAAVLVANFGEAGALDRFARLPRVYSGHNELYAWGPPPESAQVVIAVGIDADRLAADFGSCQVVRHVDNGLGVDNPEQGQPISLCRGRRAAWSQLWPNYRHLSAYL